MSWPETFGDTTAEYVATHDAAGFVGASSALFWAVGPDAVSFLQGIITQDVAGMQPGSVARSMLLEPRGKLASLLWLLRDDERVGIVTASDVLDDTIASLSRWRMRVDVEFESDDRPMFEVWGPQPTLGDDLSQPEVPGWSERDGVLVATLTIEPHRRAVVAGLSSEALTERGLAPVGTLVATTLRIEAGEPVMGVDVDEKTIPQESGLVEASVSFTKGCYLGQELVARIDSRGRVNRHLRAIRITESVLPPVGSEVVFGDVVVGLVTSVGESLAVKAPVAMALLRKEAEPEAAVRIRWEGGETVGTVAALPLPVA